MPIVISGPIGAGKSTLCRKLLACDKNIKYLGEYDQTEIGHKLLLEFQKGKVNGDVLQLFIADWWTHVPHCEIYERLPRESLIFAREQIQDKRILPILEDMIIKAEQRLGLDNIPIV